ncbi:MAG: hypothetical protein U5K54_04965 [Cytophagales bacterium]|nr:hypothetical protein [Cytophagales bacterium]
MRILFLLFLLGIATTTIAQHNTLNYGSFSGGIGIQPKWSI